VNHTFTTGANRGIGLELTRQSLQRGDRVFASCRLPDQAEALQQLQGEFPDRLTVLPLDVTETSQIDAAVKVVSSHTDALDLLLNNAAVAVSGERLGNLDPLVIIDAISVNSVAPIIIAQSLLPLLKKGREPKIINITSQLGSISRKASGGRYSYDGSKAALNMFTRTLAFEVLPHNILAVVMHPGWVRTDMGGSSAPLSVEESARGILQVAGNLTKDDVGRFLQWDGAELPW
jgi:NAD(P)-dependent dehydrogenase (short-subunit alcohol dehydrogenase family)